MRRAVVACIMALCVAFSAEARDINLKAKADGKTKITSKLQKAIDEVSMSGGGRVTLKRGVYLTGPIELKSGVELHIDSTAVLLFSNDIADYPNRTNPRHYETSALPRWRNASMIFADEATNISITGSGTIDCNGDVFVAPKTGDTWTGWHFDRCIKYEESIPRVVFFAGCSDIRVEGVKMIHQPAGWSYWIHDCDRVTFKGCKILADVRYPNNDGIHLNCSRDVHVSDCLIETGDDSIVIRANSRSLRENKPCERVYVENCYLRSWSSAVRIGWTNDGVIRDCHFKNITMYDCSNAISCYLPKMKYIINSNDYGRESTLVENISFEDITMHEIYGAPIYFYAAEDPEAQFTGIRDVRFIHVFCHSLEMPYLCGRECGAIENILYDRCTFMLEQPSAFPGDVKRHGYVGKGRAESVNVKNVTWEKTLTIDR